MSQFGHIDLRISDLAAALSFYDQLLPAVGFTERYQGEEWKVWATTEPPPSTPYFAITEEPGHVANSTRIAFWVPSEADVDRVTELARSAGAADVSGRSRCPIARATTRRSSRIHPGTGLRCTSVRSSAPGWRSHLRVFFV